MPGLPRLSTLLIVDDDPLIVDTLRFLLEQDFRVASAASRSEAIALLDAADVPPSVALVDLGLPPSPHRPDEGLHLISEMLARDPASKIIVLSGQNDDANGRHARTLGALDFIAKPAPPDVVREAVLRAARLHAEDTSGPVAHPALHRLVGQSTAMRQVREQILQFAASRFPVLIEGESGVGKELAAQALHETGPQAASPFLALNCAAIAPGLIEATLFGHTRGAFTGATGVQAGYFEEAADGTLLLDEIGELPLELQPKLLRVLETGDYQRVGETQPRKLRARILAATNRDLRQEVRAGRFRSDLFHRLGVLMLRMPPLRELGEDRFVLLDAQMKTLCAQMTLKPFALDMQARERWLSYDFPGNVRELRNIVIRLLSRHAGAQVGQASLLLELEPDDPRSPPLSGIEPAAPAPSDALAALQAAGQISLDEALRRVERDYIAAALRLAHGNMSQAARMLGINRSTLYSRMEMLARHGEDPTPEPPDH